MTVAAWQQRPESRGYVRARSADPFAPPIIQTNYLAEEIDRRVVVAGMKLARRLLASSPLAPYYAYEDFPGPNVQSDDEFLAAATERGTTTFHPGCTCRMGPADNPMGRGRRPAARARPGRPARGRRLDHAAHDLGQPQRLDPDDRRQGLRHDPRQDRRRRRWCCDRRMQPLAPCARMRAGRSGLSRMQADSLKLLATGGRHGQDVRVHRTQDCFRDASYQLLQQP